MKFVFLLEEVCLAFRRYVGAEDRALEVTFCGFEEMPRKMPPFDHSKSKLVKIEGFVSRVQSGPLPLQVTVMCLNCSTSKVRPASGRVASLL